MAFAVAYRVAIDEYEFDVEDQENTMWDEREWLDFCRYDWSNKEGATRADTALHGCLRATGQHCLNISLVEFYLPWPLRKKNIMVAQDAANSIHQIYDVTLTISQDE